MNINGRFHVQHEDGLKTILPETSTVQVKGTDGQKTIEQMLTEINSITPEQTTKLEGIVSAGSYYVDSVNGSDDNDGRTLQTAWKTLKKASQFFSYKILNGDLINLYFADGEYTGSFNLYNFIGNITLKSIGSSVNLTTPDTATGSSNIKLVDVIGTVRVEGVNITATRNEGIYYPLSAYNVSYLIIGSNTVIDCININDSINATGMYISNTNTSLSGTIKDANKAFICINGAKIIVASTAKFINCRYRDINQSILYSTNVSLPPLFTSTRNNLDSVKIENGIIVESGYNTNGRFVKYGDGTLICHGQLVFNVTAGAETFKDWAFPHLFIEDQNDGIGYPSLFSSVKSYSTSPEKSGTSLLYKAGYGGSLATCRVHNPTQTQTITVSLMAIGRWK